MKYICWLINIPLGVLETLTNASGFTVYKDEKPNTIIFTCGAKLLVLDMTFIISTAPDGLSSSTQHEPESPITLDSLHLVGDESSLSPGAQAAEDQLPKLLAKTVRDFIQACLKHPSDPDRRNVTVLLERYRSYLEQLVLLDELAAAGPPHGVRWLREVGNLTVLTDTVVADEARAISQYVFLFISKHLEAQIESNVVFGLFLGPWRPLHLQVPLHLMPCFAAATVYPFPTSMDLPCHFLSMPLLGSIYH